MGRRPSSPEAVRPYFLSRAIRQALIRAPCFGAAVRPALCPPPPPAIPSSSLTTRRPFCSLSIPSSDHSPRFTHPEASTSPLYAVLVYYTTTSLNVSYFQTSCKIAPCSTGARQILPHTVRPALCPSDRTPRFTHPGGSVRVLYAVLVYHTTMGLNASYF